MMERLEGKPEEPEVISSVRKCIRDAAYLLQERMLGIEDLNGLQDDFLKGFHLILVRRYSNSGRVVNFEFEDELKYFFNGLGEEQISDIHSSLNEIVTNDLKYGYGRAEWSIFSGDNNVIVAMSSNSGYRLSHNRTGSGTGNIKRRIENAGGSSQYSFKDNIFQIRITFPFMAGDGGI